MLLRFFAVALHCTVLHCIVCMRRISELRVSVALAVVKALRRLPVGVLKEELQPLLLKVRE